MNEYILILTNTSDIDEVFKISSKLSYQELKNTIDNSFKPFWYLDIVGNYSIINDYEYNKSYELYTVEEYLNQLQKITI